MKIVFRADASIEIGSGHLMRCLALAEGLRSKGGCCTFICRNQPGNLSSLIIQKGFNLHLLNATPAAPHVETNEDLTPNLSHSAWLGVSQQQDASESNQIIKKLEPDWVVVDHYALDWHWENSIRSCKSKILVIDDLADRFHSAQILIDQTFGRTASDYNPWVSEDCKLLIGAEYSLLRPEFHQLREQALSERQYRPFKKLLINLGGVDKDNYTTIVLKTLANCQLSKNIQITVVLGLTSPWVESVSTAAAQLPWSTRVIIDTQDMVHFMMEADLAIGASGSTSWERCALGLPTIQIVIAENQRVIAERLSQANAVKLLEQVEELPNLIDTLPEWLETVSAHCRKVTDGRGVERVIATMGVQ